MAVLHVKERWRYKPRGPVEIDRGSEWARGLLACFELTERSAGGPARDLVTGFSLPAVVGTQRVLTPHGPAADFALADNFASAATFPMSGDGQTWEVLCAIDAYDTFGTVLLGNTTNYCYIATDLLVRVGGTGIVVNVNFDDAAYRVLHFCGDASGCDLFVNGVSAGTTGSAATALSNGTIRIGGFADGAGNNDLDGRIVYARLFNYRFTAAQARARATWAQYAHLKPRVRRLYFDPAAAGGLFVNPAGVGGGLVGRRGRLAA